MCGSDLQREHSGDGCLSSSILLNHERSRKHLLVPNWARVRRVALRSVVSECCMMSGMVVSMCVMFVLILASSLVLGFV